MCKKHLKFDDIFVETNDVKSFVGDFFYDFIININTEGDRNGHRSYMEKYHKPDERFNTEETKQLYYLPRKSQHAFIYIYLYIKYKGEIEIWRKDKILIYKTPNEVVTLWGNLDSLDIEYIYSGNDSGNDSDDDSDDDSDNEGNSFSIKDSLVSVWNFLTRNSTKDISATPPNVVILKNPTVFKDIKRIKSFQKYVICLHNNNDVCPTNYRKLRKFLQSYCNSGFITKNDMDSALILAEGPMAVIDKEYKKSVTDASLESHGRVIELINNYKITRKFHKIFLLLEPKSFCSNIKV